MRCPGNRAFRLGWEEARVAKEKLNARGKVTVNAKVTYTPQGGAPPNTESKKINLIRLSAEHCDQIPDVASSRKANGPVCDPCGWGFRGCLGPAQAQRRSARLTCRSQAGYGLRFADRLPAESGCRQPELHRAGEAG